MNSRLEALLHKAVLEYDQTNANLNNNFGPDGFILKNLIKVTDPLPTKVNKVVCHYMLGAAQDKNFLSIKPEDARIEINNGFILLTDYLERVGVKKESEPKCKCKSTDQGELNQTLEEMITTLDKFINVLEGLK